MKIAILGGGFTGLAAAHDLSKKGHDVTLYERGAVLGGLAAGFKEKEWDWYIERAYHHLFSNDSDILGLADDTGFKNIMFKSPITASYYNVGSQGRTFPLDTPMDLLRFPLLTISERVRTGAVLAFLKFVPFLPVYEEYAAQDFLKVAMGEHAYEVMFGELFRKKFGKYAGKILTSFIWARITKRTKELGYVKGGFQVFIDHLEQTLIKQGVNICKSVAVESIEKKGEEFILTIQEGASTKKKKEVFDRVVSTLPTPVLANVAQTLFPAEFLQNLRSIQYLHAVCLILQTEKPILAKEYWLNICVPELSAMLVAQHTNLVDKKHYGNKNLLYMANYVEGSDTLVKMNDKEILAHYVPQLKKLKQDYDGTYGKYFIFKAPFAQPIFDKKFLKSKPDFETPVPGFYIANLDMTYPYDRGTNYAVKLGRQVAGMI